VAATIERHWFYADRVPEGTLNSQEVDVIAAGRAALDKDLIVDVPC
jgi:hypothetical protein